MRLQLGILILFLVLPATLTAQAREDSVDVFDFEALDLDGQTFDGRSLRGKTVLIDFWAIWCAPCVKAFPQLSRLQDELGGDTFQVLGMAAYSGGPARVKQFLSDKGVSYPVLVVDADLVEQFGVIGYPTYFLVDGEGHVQQKFVGELSRLYDEIAALVNQESGDRNPAGEEK